VSVRVRLCGKRISLGIILEFVGCDDASLAELPSMFPSQEAVRFKTSASWVRLLGFLMVLCLSGVGWGVGLLVIGRSLIPASLLILFSGSLAALCWNGIGHLRD
jgi:hypothetical protein